MPRTLLFANAFRSKSFLVLFFKKELLLQKRSNSFCYVSVAIASAATLILVAGVCAAFVPAAWRGNWTDHVVALQPRFVDRFFPFDAVWYQRIASDGYAWVPAEAARQQDIAFFPLWPLILRMVTLRWLVVGLAGCIAVVSICAFNRLALRLLPRRAAGLATLLFTLYPGAGFLLLSYPTGLMNLLAVLALLALLDHKLWIAAACAGLMTAAGPLGLGTALTVCVCAAGERSGRRALAWRAGVGLLSLSGLLAFMLWQHFALGDAFAFIKAQSAWAPPLPWVPRLAHAALHALILPDFWGAAREMVHAAGASSRVALQAGLERALNRAVLGLALIGLLAGRRVVAWPVLLQGALTMALYIWFDSASNPGHACPRLIYCAIAPFLGVAWLLRDRRRLGVGVVAVSALLLAGGVFLTDAGYHVV